MEVKVRTRCDNCNGRGAICLNEADGMIHEGVCWRCDGTGWVETWREDSTNRDPYEVNKQLTARIERLEQIVVSMAAGSKSSFPDAGEMHTHWVYPIKGVKALVEEIKGEEDEETFRCARCGSLLDVLGIRAGRGICVECESEIAEEQGNLYNISDIEEMEWNAKIALHDGQLCAYYEKRPE